MKRKGIAAAVLAVLLVFASGCGRQTGVTLDVDETAAAIQSGIAFDDVLSEVSDSVVQALYPGTDEDVVQQKVLVSTGATAEEIAVFETVDAEAAERVKAAVLRRIEEQKINFVDYVPAEMPKLEDPYLETAGSYVIFCVSPKADDVEQLMTTLFDVR